MEKTLCATDSDNLIKWKKVSGSRSKWKRTQWEMKRKKNTHNI